MTAPMDGTSGPLSIFQRLTSPAAVCLVLGGALALAACSLVFNPELKEFGEFGETCSGNDDCLSEMCVGGYCTRQCNASSPCDGGSLCRTASGMCEFGEFTAFGEACTDNDECESELCVAERCTHACDGDNPCASPAVCRSDSGLCEWGEWTPFGGICDDDEECESEVCSDGRCTRECHESSNPCPDGSECRESECYFLRPPALVPPVKVGFMYADVVEDYGMIRTHSDALTYILENVTDAEGTGLPDVASSAASSAIDGLVGDGHNVIIGTNSSFLTPLQTGALHHDGVNFLVFGTYSDFAPGVNIGSYSGRMYQVMYMMGRIAGQKTATNRIGVVAPVPEPESVRNINAFTQGVRSKNTDAQVIVDWVQSWSNEGLEIAATENLVDNGGADIILGYTDTDTPLTTAASMSAPGGETVYVIGYGNPDICDSVPSRCLSAAYWNWGPMLVDMVEEMLAGTWQPEAIWNQIERDPPHSAVYFAEISATLVSSVIRMDVEGLVDDLSNDTTAGRMLPFEGTVRDTANTVRISSGRYPTDDDLIQMCWFVLGTFEVEDGEPPTLVPAVVPLSCRGEH